MEFIEQVFYGIYSNRVNRRRESMQAGIQSDKDDERGFSRIKVIYINL
jgi:hypothetical protein